jgi:phosphoenolpyruvate synthase/pyruvate phosphate dikinase
MIKPKEERQMNENENNNRIKLSLDMQNAINVCRLSAIVGMFYDTILKLDDTWYPKELRPALNEFRYETLNEFRKKIITWMVNNFYCEGE